MEAIFVFWKMCRDSTVLWGVSTPKEANLRQHFKETVLTVGWDIVILLGTLPIFGEFSHFRSFAGRQSLPSTPEGENARYLLSPGPNHRKEVSRQRQPLWTLKTELVTWRKDQKNSMWPWQWSLPSQATGSGALAASRSVVQVQMWSQLQKCSSHKSSTVGFWVLLLPEGPRPGLSDTMRYAIPFRGS